MPQVAMLLVIVIAVAACTVDTVAEPEPEPAPTVTIDWTVAERFGPDANGNGVVDLPNSLAYVRAATSDCDLDSCGRPTYAVAMAATLDPAPSPNTEFLWRIGTDAFTTTTPEVSVDLTEGTHRVELTIQPSERETSGHAVALVEVHDIFIGVVGDGWAAGDGAPERSVVSPNVVRVGIGDSDAVGAGGTRLDVTWADPGHASPGIVTHFRFESVVPAGPAYHVEITAPDDVAAAHARAHRSSSAAAALAARELERADRRTSVTFVNLASSGASLTSGVLEASEDGSPSQLDRLARLAGCAPAGDHGVAECVVRPDVLVVSTGYEDVGVPQALLALVARGSPLFDAIPGATVELPQLTDAVASGDWAPLRPAFEAVASVTGAAPPATRSMPIGDLPEALDALAARLTAEIRPKAVVVVPYPDPFVMASGASCISALGTITPLGELDRTEIDWLRRELLQPLDAALVAAADRHDWLVARFDGPTGGICEPPAHELGNDAGRPYPPPLANPSGRGVRWFLEADEAAAIVGGFTSTAPPSLLPNIHGRQAMATAIAEAIDSSS